VTEPSNNLKNILYGILSFLLSYVLVFLLISHVGVATYLVLPISRTQRPPAPARPPSAAKILPQEPSKPQNSPTAVRAYVVSRAKELGVNSVDAAWIVDHESQDGQNMRGDDGQSRGYWMISKVWHPEVSDRCADDLECSTDWSLRRILAGHIREWSTWRLRFKLYPTDNPPL